MESLSLVTAQERSNRVKFLRTIPVTFKQTLASRFVKGHILCSLSGHKDWRDETQSIYLDAQLLCTISSVAFLGVLAEN